MPWLNAPMLADVEPGTQQVCFCAPTGAGKTTIMEVLGMYIIAVDSGDTLIVFQTDPDGKEWAEMRFKHVLNACKPAQPFLPKDRHARKKTEIYFPHMSLIIGGANMNTLQSKSMRWLYGDEVWRWLPGMLEEFIKRTHDQWNAHIFLASQGGDEETEWHQACKKGQLHEWRWECPDCGHVHPFRFGDLKWDDVMLEGGEKDLEAIGQSVRMVCPDCEATFCDTDINRRRLAMSGRYVVQPGPFTPGHKTFSCNALTIYRIPWRKLVFEWIEANKEKNRGNMAPLKAFLQKRLAQFWKEEESTPWGALTGSGYKKAEFVSGQIWEGETYRFLTVDVQRDHYWFVVRAWKTDGSSRLISEGKALTIEGIRAIQEQYGVKDALVLLDAQHDTGRIYDACARWGWTALHGSKEARFKHYPKGGKPIARFYSPIQIASAPGGGKCRYAFWSNEKIKDSLALLRPGKGAPWETPDDVSADYVKQIDSELKKEIINKVTKAVELRWVKIKDDNHLWDCECMQVASAMMLGVLGGGDAPA